MSESVKALARCLTSRVLGQGVFPLDPVDRQFQYIPTYVNDGGECTAVDESSVIVTTPPLHPD